MGTIFEDLVRRFNEDNNEEAGEHWTPRDAVELMAQLVFQPSPGTKHRVRHLPALRRRHRHRRHAHHRRADPAGNSGGERASGFPRTSTGRRLTTRPTRFARPTCSSRRERDVDENIIGGPQHSTLSNDAFRSQDLRLHAEQSPLREELEGGPGPDGRQVRPEGFQVSSSSTTW